MSDPAVINGKRYSLWPQFVEKKAEWIGGTLEEAADRDLMALGASDGSPSTTTIKDITFEPCGEDSAEFAVVGEDFTCSINVQYGFVDPHKGGDGWIAFGGYGGFSFRIKKKE